MPQPTRVLVPETSKLALHEGKFIDLSDLVYLLLLCFCNNFILKPPIVSLPLTLASTESQDPLHSSLIHSPSK